MAHYTGLIDKYRDRLPVAADARVISLNEGATPLIELKNLPGLVRKKVRILAKFDGLNPTGSFKDRGMTMAVTRAVEEGARAIICASTGNTSASAAAYAARAGIACFVLIPEGKIALGKLAQAMMHGSTVLQIRGNFDDGMRLVQEVATDDAGQHRQFHQPVPHPGPEDRRFRGDRGAGRRARLSRAAGRQRRQHHRALDRLLRIGRRDHAGAEGRSRACASTRRRRSRRAGRSCWATRPPARRRSCAGASVENPETVATAIRIGNPVSWQQAVAATRESGGWFAECTDQEILHVQKLLAQAEGIFCEPASAIALAGLLKDLELGKVGEGSTIVCTLTGHGLKDPDVAIAQSAKPLTVDAELRAVERVIREHLPKS